MTTSSARQRHAELCREISRHNRLYYQLDRPEISDAAYDALFRELLDLEERYPDLRPASRPVAKSAHRRSTSSPRWPMPCRCSP